MAQYVFKEKHGNFIALDSGSGGYPYTVDTVFRAEIWTSRKEAFIYRKMFEPWDLYEIKTVIMEKVIPVEVQEVHYE